MIRYRKLFTGAIWSALLLGGSLNEGLAQRRPNAQFMPYSKVGLGVGTSTYFGDLASYGRAPKALFTLPRWNASLMYGRQFTPYLSARASFTYARITGDDYTFNRNNVNEYALLFTRNLHFRNDLKEFAITGMYQVIPDGRSSEHRVKFSPYVMAGIALLAHNPQARLPISESADSSRRWVNLRPLGTEGQGLPGYAKPYSLVTLAIPVGIGFRYKINDAFDFGFDISYRYTFSNYLDDVGGTYANPDDLQGLSRDLADRRLEQFAARTNADRTALFNQAVQQGVDLTNGQRGTTGRFNLNDGYLLTSFQLHYVIPGQIKCPPIR